MFSSLARAAQRAPRRIRTAFGEVHDEERGDIPGWVLVTLMTAAIVVAIWLLAEPALRGLFEDAMNRVTSL